MCHVGLEISNAINFSEMSLISAATIIQEEPMGSHRKAAPGNGYCGGTGPRDAHEMTTKMKKKVREAAKAHVEEVLDSGYLPLVMTRSMTGARRPAHPCRHFESRARW